MTPPTYVCSGSVRGECSHRHRTLSGALRCLERDRSGCHAQGGYSDREVYERGPTGRLHPVEDCDATDEDCYHDEGL